MIDQHEIVTGALDAFQAAFDRKPRVVALAPGRVNLIGEHTDYNGGFVLPAAVPYWTAVAAAPDAGGEVRVVSSAMEGMYRRRRSEPEPAGEFGDYVLGAVREMTFSSGLDAAIHSNLPMSAGLSSSAALEVATVAALLDLSGLDMEPVEIARAARRVENNFVGVPCGFMDQFIVACAVNSQASLLDCETERWETLPAVFPEARWLVIDTGIKRELTGGDYASKVRASGGAWQRLRIGAGLPHEDLRVLAEPELLTLCRKVGIRPDETALLRHFVLENRRVLRMKEALMASDSEEAGMILREGHWSLSRDFRVSLPEIDAFVRACELLPGCLGVRITGAGFGGSLVALVMETGAEQTMKEMRAAASAHLPEACRFLEISGFPKGVSAWRL